MTLALAGLGYLLLSLVITLPLAWRLTTGVPHDLGDPVLTTSILWWNARVTPLTAAWWSGPWFFPEAGSLAFSDHRLGASLIASPLQWLGLGPVGAYNVTLILSFPLCALAAFALVKSLTGRVDAAAVAGLAYGFNPYRMAHIEHLELLLAFGMPLALLALHRYWETRERRWLAALSAALCLQGLSSSYYLLFFSVFMALWVVWFLRWRDWRAFLAIAVASLVPIALLAPIYMWIAEIHQRYGFRRGGGEIAAFGADVTSILTASPMLAVWGWTSSLNGPERQTYPGLTIVLLALAGMIGAFRSRHVAKDRLATVARGCWVTSVVVGVVGLAAQRWGPFHLEMGPLRLAVDVLSKPLSVALLVAVVGVLLSARLRDAYQRRSLLAFYGTAVAAMYLLSLGHQPKLLGEAILYRPPYSWLMSLPGFSDSVRVPARFAMPAVLALSVAGGLGFARIRARAAFASALLGVCLLAIAADTWPRAFPVREVPGPWSATPDSDVVAVMELPLGGAESDATAVYRVASHGLPSINGISGYLTPRYLALVRAIGGHEPEALDAVAAHGPVFVATAKQEEAWGHWAEYVAGFPGARPAGEDERWRFFRLERSASAPPFLCGARLVRPVTATDAGGPVDVKPLVDADPATLWTTQPEEVEHDALTVDLGAVMPVCGVGFSLGAFAHEYPRDLAVSWSRDGLEWTAGFRGSTSGLALRSAVDTPLDARIELPMGAEARFVQLHLVRSRPADRWMLAELYARTGP